MQVWQMVSTNKSGKKQQQQQLVLTKFITTIHGYVSNGKYFCQGKHYFSFTLYLSWIIIDGKLHMYGRMHVSLIA